MLKLFQPNEEFSEQYKEVKMSCPTLAPFFMGTPSNTVNMPHKTYTLSISFEYSDRILVVQLFKSENEELQFLMYILGCMPEGVLFEN